MKYKTLLTSIFGMSFVTALLAGCGAPATQSPTPIPPAPTSIPPVTSTLNILSQTLTIGDYQYVMKCSGEGSPVVLLLGGRAAAWKPIQAEINRFTRTCVFDHMGSNSTPLTAEQIAKNLHMVLEDAEMTTPYVLVGFSVGGFIARLFANLYPDEVTGIALLDSSHEDQNARFLTALPPEPLNECQELKDYRIELQASHLIPIGSEINLDFDASADEVRAKKQNLGKMPMVILTAGRSEWPDCFPPEVRENLDQAWLEMQNDLASLSANNTHLIAKESGHNFAEQPETVIDAIQEVVNNVRTGAGESAPVTLASNQLVVVIPVGSNPHRLAIGEGALWVVNSGANTVSRIDLETDQVVATIKVGYAPASVSVGEGAVWVANNYASSVSRIDPKTNEVIAAIKVGEAPRGVVVGERSVWVTVGKEDIVARIDPATNQVMTTIQGVKSPAQIAVGEDAIWVTSRNGNLVSRIDPQTNQVVATVDIGYPTIGLAITRNAVWVTGASDPHLTRIDSTTDQVVTQISVANNSWGVAATEDAVWVTTNSNDTLFKIDPKTNQLVATFAVGSGPVGITLGDNVLWVANEDDNTVWKIKP